MDFSQISLLLVVAAFSGIIVKKLKQPILIGYLFAGFLLSAFGFLTDHVLIDNLGKIGVALLLFLVGLEMNIRELPTIGKAALYTGLGQIFFTFTIGLVIGLLLGFNLTVSSYLAIAASFSSTIIIIKLLSEKNVLSSLFGKITVGFLLVQDFVAILILVFLASLGREEMNPYGLLLLVVKGLGLFVVIWLLSKKVLPALFERYVAASSELLFIVSIAWALGLASLVAGPLGFTLEIGGFLAGLALSNLPEHLEIASRTRPLRDFFLTIFFLSLGTNLIIEDVGKVIVPALIYSLLVLIVKPTIVMIVMGFLRFKKRTSFLTSVTGAQISEFSLIVVSVGFTLGHLEKTHIALVVLVAAITMTASTYLVIGVEKIYAKIKDALGIFERKNTKEINVEKSETLSNHIVLIGCLRTGPRLLTFFKKKQTPYVIVDFNPDIYNKLSAENEPIVFGDITDPEILDAIQIERALLVISTIDSLSDNLTLLEHLAHLEKKPLSVFTSSTRGDALKLYEFGASYVIVPDIVAGDHIRNLLRLYGTKGTRIAKAGKNHFNRLVFT
ncbi:hypothetical protein A3A75_05730 [Candidatus Woesebacteria bacterium RIFCSPLOWO2_01_FULL_39_10]|uniref:Uncharacterized protein n=1 Tax=Candidatus Woesebacteria bacterium RIFCSPLOWO2_01_FULL_39_10 TaxID=1802516 RepID=A0A1F8B807_9BACT|nr:MAG: hypothetical protein A3A75_05730 [Candidatus Woesebacteria bacterium RIFCSPLOWO2_01_FULL_39_10]